MDKQKGIKTVVLSGMRATVVMEKGNALEKEAVGKALQQSGVKLVSMEVIDQAVATAACRMNAKGLG